MAIIVQKTEWATNEVKIYLQHKEAVPDSQLMEFLNELEILK